jgi:hypothetical protein
MTPDEIDAKLRANKILEDKWPKETHEAKHKRTFDNLIELLSDIENSDVELPRNGEGAIEWESVSISYLIQWSLMNAQKISHKHEVKDVQKGGNPNETQTTI